MGAEQGRCDLKKRYQFELEVDAETSDEAMEMVRALVSKREVPKHLNWKGYFHSDGRVYRYGPLPEGYKGVIEDPDGAGRFRGRCCNGPFSLRDIGFCQQNHIYYAVPVGTQMRHRYDWHRISMVQKVKGLLQWDHAQERWIPFEKKSKKA